MILVTGGAGFIGSNLQAALVAPRARDGRRRPARQRRQVAQPRQASAGAADPPGATRRLPGRPPAARDGVPSRRDQRAPPRRTATESGRRMSSSPQSVALVRQRRRAAHLRLVRSHLRRRQRGLRRRRCERSRRAAAAQPVWLDQARLRPARRAHAGRRTRPRPPQWAGLKFFNVYGPNEYHKGHMISVVKVKLDEVAAGQPAAAVPLGPRRRADGEQKRDFIWVGDVVDVMLWLLDTPHVNGLFNVGTGQRAQLSRSGPCGLRRRRRAAAVEFVDMPERAARPVSVVHRGADGPAARGRLRRPVHPARGRRAPLRAGLPGAARPLRDDPRPAVSAIRPGHRPDRSVGHPLVCAGLYRRPGARLALLRRLVRQTPAVATTLQADDFLTWATLGVVLGGRLGYVLFYQPCLYLAHPLEIFAVWQGGMSFHGGVLGVTIAIVLFCRAQQHPAAGLRRSHRRVRADRPGPRAHRQLHQRRAVGPAGARLVPWAMIFPAGGPVPRHPEPALRGAAGRLVLFVRDVGAVPPGGDPGPVRLAHRGLPHRLRAARASPASSSASRTRFWASSSSAPRWASCCRSRCCSPAPG